MFALLVSQMGTCVYETEAYKEDSVGSKRNPKSYIHGLLLRDV